MLIVLALVAAVAIGMALHFALPLRSTRGVALGPLLDAAIAAAIYTSLTWLGVAESNPWLWAASIVVPAVVTGVVLVVLSRARAAHDERERVRLKLV
jgi:predicted small integral membrane protein